MAAILALTAAAAYGAGDFLGGVAARRAAATAVVLWSHLVGLTALVVAAPLMSASGPTAPAMGWGAVAGLVGAGGVALLYRALSVGSMSVVAPIAALLSAIVPVFVGVATGERPQPAALVGTAVALLAITLVSREPGSAPADADRHRTKAVLMALVAGFAFGLFFVTIGEAGTESGMWPLVGARVASVALFASLATSRVVEGRLPREALGAAAVCGLLDVAANVSYVVALDHGLLSVVSVLASLYPAGTVLLARYVLGERMTPVQQVGLGFAAGAALLITV